MPITDTADTETLAAFEKMKLSSDPHLKTNLSVHADTGISGTQELRNRLQDLPQELYDMIWDYTFTVPTDGIIAITKTLKPPAVTQVSRETRQALLKDYWGQNRFLPSVWNLDHALRLHRWLESAPCRFDGMHERLSIGWHWRLERAQIKNAAVRVPTGGWLMLPYDASRPNAFVELCAGGPCNHGASRYCSCQGGGQECHHGEGHGCICRVWPHLRIQAEGMRRDYCLHAVMSDLEAKCKKLGEDKENAGMQVESKTHQTDADDLTLSATRPTQRNERETSTAKRISSWLRAALRTSMEAINKLASHATDRKRKLTAQVHDSGEESTPRLTTQAARENRASNLVVISVTPGGLSDLPDEDR